MTLPVLSSSLKLKNIQRFPGKLKSRGYSVAEHSYYTSLIFSFLCKDLGVDISSDDVYTVLLHDLMESETGDLPYTIKNIDSIVKRLWEEIEERVSKSMSYLDKYTDKGIKEKLGEKKYSIFKLSDQLEVYLWIKEELKLNASTYLFDVQKRIEDNLSEVPKEYFPSIMRVMSLSID